jgi:hydrogenase-4 component F
VALFGTVLFAFGLGGAVATAAGLLHLTLGCLALTAAASGSWPAMLGVAGLVGLPPFGVFATGFALVGQSAEHGLALAALFAVAWFAVAALALRGWRPPESGNPAGWLGVALMLWLGLLMPHGVAGWLQGIAAAAR